ncbi:carboxypeptidase-like regulatory domain-containing protein [Pedobacter jamesrossensis]|uniref:Carboxypeptidase-like regulatory domain-containing protein n=1 Tax=Pedobacter jamesrossensis TaxID=1908238 RepID=A0ABV8NRM8_9SPHI
MKILLLIFICFSGLNALAQVNGKVTDEKGQGLPGSVIRLYTKSQLSKTILTHTAGYFNANLPGLDQLIITALGYRPDTVYTVQRALGTIRLQPVASQLKDISIQARQSMIRQETDRSIISVNQSVKKLAANGLEIVGLAPNVIKLRIFILHLFDF